jgi:hypothetical protein
LSKTVLSLKPQPYGPSSMVTKAMPGLDRR